MAKRTRKGSRRQRRQRKRQVGGQTQSYGFAMKPVYGGVPDSNMVVREGCNAAVRPGILGGQTQGSGIGLPMSGGRYQFAGEVNPNTGMWTSGGSSIPCESSMRNPLNSGSGAGATNLLLRQSGGVAPYSGGTPMQETTAGYTHLADGGDGSIGRLSDGSPFMLNNPAGGRVGVSAACLTTGGSRRQKRHHSRKCKCSKCRNYRKYRHSKRR